ncbi:hypothetical protein ACWC0C_38480 [Streptomyces sp. NPDC001709]
MASTFDLDTWVKEARKEPFSFTLAGTVFTMPAAGELDKSVLSAVNVDSPSAVDIENLLKKGLGEQWPRFDAIPAPIAALGELFRQWQKHEGVPLGESSALSDS